MPFPATLESLFAAGYEYARYETCSACGMDVEVYLTPGKREMAFEPMCGGHSPATKHYEVCKSLPKTRDGLMQAVYLFLHRAVCGKCNRAVERYKSPDDLILTFEPMMEPDWPVVVHRCVQAHPSPAPEKPQEQPSAAQQIAMHGVTDKNMIACGWSGGILEIAFKYGRYRYENVPENVFSSLRKVPYPNAYFTKAVKNHPELYPCTKVG